MPSWQLAFDPQVWESANRSYGLMVRGRRAFPELSTSVSVGLDAELSPGSRMEQGIAPTQSGGIYTGYTRNDVQYDYDVRFWQAAPYIQVAIAPLPRLYAAFADPPLILSLAAGNTISILAASLFLTIHTDPAAAAGNLMAAVSSAPVTSVNPTSTALALACAVPPTATVAVEVGP